MQPHAMPLIHLHLPLDVSNALKDKDKDREHAILCLSRASQAVFCFPWHGLTLLAMKTVWVKWFGDKRKCWLRVEWFGEAKKWLGLFVFITK